MTFEDFKTYQIRVTAKGRVYYLELLILKLLKHGECWCDEASGYPMGENHDATCSDIRNYFRQHEDAQMRAEAHV